MVSKRFLPALTLSGQILLAGVLPDEGSRKNGLGEIVLGTVRNLKNCYTNDVINTAMGKGISDRDLGDFPMTLEYCDKLAIQCDRGNGICCSVMPADDGNYVADYDILNNVVAL